MMENCRSIRTEYDIEHSVLKNTMVVTVSEKDGEKEVQIDTPNEVKYLFTTKTCSNCGMAKELLKETAYVLIDAEENMELTREYGVMQAPTLVVVSGDTVKKYVNVSNITKYVEQSKIATEA